MQRDRAAQLLKRQNTKIEESQTLTARARGKKKSLMLERKKKQNGDFGYARQFWVVSFGIVSCQYTAKLNSNRWKRLPPTQTNQKWYWDSFNRCWFSKQKNDGLILFDLRSRMIRRKTKDSESSSMTFWHWIKFKTYQLSKWSKSITWALLLLYQVIKS